MMSFDTNLLETLYASRDQNLTPIFIAITQMGSTLMVGGLSLALGLYLLTRQKLSYFAGLCISILGTAGLVYGLKELVGRARPGMFYQAYLETGFSFPSGHAAFSLALYGFIAYLLWKHSSRYRFLLAAIFIIFIVLVGFSRLYLGVHFASDVIGGYAIGALCLALGILASEKLNRYSIWS